MLVYKATNSHNGKGYIGITCQALKQRMAQHRARAGISRTAFACALKKYGFDSFTWEILEVCDNREQLEAAEVRLIAQHGTRVEVHGYNRTDGGAGTGGLRPSQETLRKMAEASRGRPVTAATREKLRANAKAQDLSKFRGCRAGAKRTPESIQRWRASMANVQLKPPTPEAIASRTDALRRRAQAGIGVKVQPTEWPQIAARRANGETYKDIAADYGVRKETIFYFCKRHGGAA